MKKVTWTESIVKQRANDLVAKDGWHPSDHGLRKHALWTLAVDHALDNDIWDWSFSIDTKTTSALFTP